SGTRNVPLLCRQVSLSLCRDRPIREASQAVAPGPPDSAARRVDRGPNRGTVHRVAECSTGRRFRTLLRKAA
ncbi:MAG: hypothetical protein K2Y40_08790, partial [Reyranella sp.]|nr:hypothetical protein [Reyranella sp.]